MIDPWAHLPNWNKPFNVDDLTFEEVYAEALRKTDFAASRRIVLRGRTSAVIDEVPDQSLDFAYIDGDHTLRGITLDLIQVLPKIKDGGLIGGDDFVNKPWQHGSALRTDTGLSFCSLFRRGNAASICGAAPQTIPDPKSGRHLVLVRQSNKRIKLVFEETFSKIGEVLSDL